MDILRVGSAAGGLRRTHFGARGEARGAPEWHTRKTSEVLAPRQGAHTPVPPRSVRLVARVGEQLGGTPFLAIHWRRTDFLQVRRSHAGTLQSAEELVRHARILMMKEGADGEMEGYKMKPFNYSSTWVVGVKAYEKREAAELARVADFTGGGWGDAGLGIAASLKRMFAAKQPAELVRRRDEG